jgi:hypothetical protein
MTEERHIMIADLRGLPERIEALVRHLTPEQLTAVYEPGEWTIAQNVHHLADSQMALFMRFKWIVMEDYPTLKPLEQDDWAKSADSTSPEIGASLAILLGVHHRWAQLAESLDDAAWARMGYHPENGDTRLDDLFAYAVNHGQAHIDQITRVLATGSQSNGA